MSLGVAIKGTEGVVLAADSRVTLSATAPNRPPLSVNFDNATKLLSFSDGKHKHVGAITYGAAVIGLRTASSFIPEFEQKALAGKEDRLSIKEYAVELGQFFKTRWDEAMPKDYPGPQMTFVVAGYDRDAAYGSVFLFEVPNSLEPLERNAGDKDFGMTWGGQLEIGSRLIHGFDPRLQGILQEKFGLDEREGNGLVEELTNRLQFPIPYEVLPLQDCIDLAIFMVRTTIAAQNLAIGIRGVGGPVDVATITRERGLHFVQRKGIHGEAQ